VSHTHHDHFMDVPTIARRTGAMVLGSGNTCLLSARLAVAEGQLRRAEPGDRHQLGPFGVSVWPGDHPRVPGFTPGVISGRERLPLRLREYRMDTCLSFLVEAAGLVIYVCNASRLASAPRADVLCVSMAQREPYYRVLQEMVRPRLVVPMHWDDFFRPLTEPLRPFWARPRWGEAPLRRLDPAGFARSVERIGIGRALLPNPLLDYDLAALIAG
jgi:L-ascorbate metabolism protein UlaG (beta-lactamase superfamily)